MATIPTNPEPLFTIKEAADRIGVKYSMTNQEPPLYAAAFRPSDIEFWQSMDWDYSETYELLTYMTFESERDAIGEPAVKATGRKTRYRSSTSYSNIGKAFPWLVAKWNIGMDRPRLEEARRTAQRLLPRVEKAIRARALSLELLTDWGVLQHVAGELATAVDAERSDLGGFRRSGRYFQRKWIAKQVLTLTDGGMPQKVAEGEVVKHINDLLERGSFTEAFPREWFLSLLDKAHENLGSMFSVEGHLRKTDAEEFRFRDESGIPPLP